MVILLFAASALAENDHLVSINTRPGTEVSFYYMKREGAKATLVLLAGGDGGIGIEDGIPTSRNFLVRSRDFFAANGFNIAIVDKEDGLSRSSSEHIEDLRRVAAHLKKDAKAPVWIVGTSRGTISAAAAATTVGDGELGGIVLTSSVTSREPDAVPFQKLDAIRVPVLVVHHERDACKICDPREADEIIRRLKNAPIKKIVFVKAGATSPSGNPCKALHYHGFIGVEKETVDLISTWIKNPAP